MAYGSYGSYGPSYQPRYAPPTPTPFEALVGSLLGSFREAQDAQYRQRMLMDQEAARADAERRADAQEQRAQTLFDLQMRQQGYTKSPDDPALASTPGPNRIGDYLKTDLSPEERQDISTAADRQQTRAMQERLAPLVGAMLRGDRQAAAALAQVDPGTAAKLGPLYKDLNPEQKPAEPKLHYIQGNDGTWFVRDERTGQTQPVQDPSGKPLRGRMPVEGAEKPVKPPVSIQKSYVENQSALARLKDLSTSLETPAAADATGLKGYLPDAVLNRVSPEGTEIRGKIANIGSLIFHDRSGAAVTVSEAKRLQPYLPLATDNLATVKKKVRLLEEEIRREQEAMEASYDFLRPPSARLTPSEMLRRRGRP